MSQVTLPQCRLFNLVISSVPSANLGKELHDLVRKFLSGSDIGILRVTPKWSQNDDADGDILVHNFIPRSPRKEYEAIHKLLDILPDNPNRLLNILWLLPKVTPSQIPLVIIDALLRAKEWFGARVFIHGKELDHGGKLDILNALVFSKPSDFSTLYRDHLVWRGHLSVLDDTTFTHRMLDGLEMSSDGQPDCKKGAKLNFSSQLNALAVCKKASVPNQLLTSQNFYNFHVQAGLGNRGAVKAFHKSGLFDEGNCILASLKAHENTFSSVNDLSFKKWKTAVMSGSVALDRTQFNKSCDVLFLMIHKRENNELEAVVLDETKWPEVESNKGCCTSSELEWDEQRFLNFLEFYSSAKQKAIPSSETMQPSSGEFVILEAKELVKFFKENGDPKGDKVLEEMNAKRCQVLAECPDVKSKPWPDSLYTEYHGYHFNRSERSEEADREAARIQRMYIGPKRETASTCSVQNDKKEIVLQRQKSVETILNPKVQTENAKKRKPELTRATSSVMSSIKSKEEVYKQKLRNAVFEALQENGIGEDHPTFLPIFKNLFDMCQVFAKTIPSNAKSTKSLLAKVARQNAKTIIDLYVNQ